MLGAVYDNPTERTANVCLGSDRAALLPCCGARASCGPDASDSEPRSRGAKSAGTYGEDVACGS